MQGRQVTRIAGWDTHGLPVEIEVEKELKLNGKKAIEEYGVARFNAKARESVFRYQSDWEQLSNRTGYWLDYENPYVTCSNEYIESVWWLLQRLHQKDMLYRGHRVLPYCPRCGTVLSSHELALGYEEIQDKSIYVTFPLADGSGRELVVWTTTPWTLPSNVAVAVHPDLEYGEYEHQGRVLIMATTRATQVIGEAPLRRAVQGAELVGLSYQRPLDVVPMPADRKHGIVVPGAFVTAEDGSGLVHMAPAFGADDYAAGQEHGLALVRPVAADGTFHGTTWPEIEGKLVTAAETNNLIIRRLKETGRLLGDPGLVRAHVSALLALQEQADLLRPRFVVRAHVGGEEADARDQRARELAAARGGVGPVRRVAGEQRRLGALARPLLGHAAAGVGLRSRPVARGSDRQLRRAGREGGPGAAGRLRSAQAVHRRVHLAGTGWRHDAPLARGDRHLVRLGVDAVRAVALPVRARGGVQGALPGRLHLRGRGPDARVVLLAAGDRDDGVRQPGVPERGGERAGARRRRPEDVEDEGQRRRSVGGDPRVRRRHRAALPAGVEPGVGAAALRREGDRGAGRLPQHAEVDLSLLLALCRRLDAGRRRRRSALDARSLGAGAARRTGGGSDGGVGGATRSPEGVRAIVDFVVDDLSNWYVRLSRARFWAPDHEADPAAVATLHECLATVARLLAPAAPFASDWLHRALTGQSVHLSGFPVTGRRRDEALEGAMDAVRRLTSLGRAARETKNIRVRQPLSAMQVAVPARFRGPLFDELLALLQSEVNVRAVSPVASDADLVRLKAKPNFRALGKKFGKRTQEAAAAVAKLDVDALAAARGRACTLHRHGDGMAA